MSRLIETPSGAPAFALDRVAVAALERPVFSVTPTREGGFCNVDNSAKLLISAGTGAEIIKIRLRGSLCCHQLSADDLRHVTLAAVHYAGGIRVVARPQADGSATLRVEGPRRPYGDRTLAAWHLAAPRWRLLRARILATELAPPQIRAERAALVEAAAAALASVATTPEALAEAPAL